MSATALDIAIKMLVAEGALRASVLAGVSFFLLRALWSQLQAVIYYVLKRDLQYKELGGDYFDRCNATR